MALLKKVFRAPYDAVAVEKSRRRLGAALTKMEQTLKGGRWLAGDAYSLADIAAAPVIDRIERLGMADLWDALPGVAGWVARLPAREAYKKAQPADEFRLPAAQVG